MSSAKIGKEELLSKLAEWNIETETVEHPQVWPAVDTGEKSQVTKGYTWTNIRVLKVSFMQIENSGCPIKVKCWEI